MISKFYLPILLLGAVIGVNADKCGSTETPTHSANSNFVFAATSNGWVWSSGTIPGTSLASTGIMTWDLNSDISVVCISYQGSGGYVCYGNPISGNTCTLSATSNIANMWGFNGVL